MPRSTPLRKRVPLRLCFLAANLAAVTQLAVIQVCADQSATVDKRSPDSGLTDSTQIGLDRKPAGLDRKILGPLTSRSEPVRVRATLKLQQSDQAKFHYLPELIAAISQNCDKLAEPSETRSGDSWPMPPVSVVSQIYMLGSTKKAEAQQCLVELLDCPNPNVVMVAAEVLGKNKFTEAIGALRSLRSNDDFRANYGYRFNLVRAIAQMENAEGTEILTDWRLELDGQLRHEIDELLSNIDESYFGEDTERFSRWQSAMQNDHTVVAKTVPADATDRDDSVANVSGGIVLADSSASSESLDRLKLQQSRQYYGIEIHAKRMMFIIDHSGSMKQYSQGMTRLDRAKSELIRVISQLEPDTQFAIMFYETRVRNWRDDLVLADERNKREAVQFVKRLQYGDRTNTYTALRESIDFSPELEAVYLLTDGHPTEGAVVAPAAIVKDILHRNRFRHLNFNTIGVSVQARTEAFLKTLASGSGGEFRALN